MNFIMDLFLNQSIFSKVLDLPSESAYFFHSVPAIFYKQL